MRSRKRGRRDEPFADSLLGGRGEPGRRQAERLTHRLIRQARRSGHDALADWLGDGFREGRFTVEGAAAAAGPLARTLAAARLCEFVEGTEKGTGACCDSLGRLGSAVRPVRRTRGRSGITVYRIGAVQECTTTGVALVPSCSFPRQR